MRIQKEKRGKKQNTHSGFGAAGGDQIDAADDEQQRHGLVPGEDVLSEEYGDTGGDDGLQVAVHACAPLP